VRQSPRTQPAKSPLSREAVLGAGLRVLRAHGIDGVTMRAVAAELDTGPASLYVYVENRQDLLNQMFDLVAGQIDPGGKPDPTRWREQVEALLTRTLEVMDRYPGIARVPLANVPTGPNIAKLADHLIAILRAGGIDDRSIAWFVDVASLFVNATAYESAIYVEAGTPDELIGEQVRGAFAHLDPARLPNLASMSALLTTGGRDERFAFGLSLLLEGLVHTSPPGNGG
jgi:AcrR family transcriptional regulator